MKRYFPERGPAWAMARQLGRASYGGRKVY